MCVRNLVRRKFRTFLTVMGVVIGTTSIVMMISLGIGISAQNEEQIKMYGDLTMIDVYWQGNEDAPLDEAAVETIQAIPGVAAASPLQYFNVRDTEIRLKAGSNGKYENQWPSVMSVYPEALEALGFKLDKGETLPASKTKTVRVVFGAETAYEFQDTRKTVNNMRNSWPDENGVVQDPFFDPLETDLTMVLTYTGGESSKKYEVPIEVCGVLVGERNRGESMYGVFFSIEDMNAIIADYEKVNEVKKARDEVKNFDNVQVKVVDIDDVAEIQTQIQDMGFGTWSPENERQDMQKSMQQMQIILGSLGGISLLVSAISITNTMIMSVYERTREIGVMKVLGCLVGNIRSIFLMEAGFVGLLGHCTTNRKVAVSIPDGVIGIFH